MSDETQQTQQQTQTSAAATGAGQTAAATAAPASGDGENIPAAYLKLSFAPAQRGTEPLPGVTLKREQVLSWRDRGSEIVVVTTEPVTGKDKRWREQKLVAAKAAK